MECRIILRILEEFSVLIYLLTGKGDELKPRWLRASLAEIHARIAYNKSMNAFSALAERT